MPRREVGKAGKQVTAITNSFEIIWSSNKVFHYHVEMTADWLKKDRKPEDMDIVSSNPNDAGAAIPRARRTELIMRLQNEIKPDVFSPQGAFDGKANLFSVTEYNFRSQGFQVPWSAPRPSRGGGGGGGGGGQGQRRPKIVTITITKVNDIDRRYLQGLVNGDKESVKQGSGAMMTLNMLNVFVQAAPRMQPRTLHNARSFYIPGDRPLAHVSAFEIWKGYYQTVRPTYDRIFVTIDYTVGAVVPKKRLLDLFMSYSGFRDTRRISELTKFDPNFRSLRLFAKQLKFIVELPGAHQGAKPKVITDLVPDSGAITFDNKHGEETSVAEHFFKTYSVTIPPKTLGVKTKSGSVFPITVCWSVEQLYRGKNAPAVVSEMMRAMPQNPRDRMSSINDSWRYLQYAQSSFMLQAGLDVKKDPLPVHGRLLTPPAVNFGSGAGHHGPPGPPGGGGNGKGEIVPHRKAGVWDVMRRKFYKAHNLDSWTVVSFEPRAQGQVVERFVDGLLQEMRSHGMNVPKPHAISTPRMAQGNVSRILKEEGAKCQAQLILVILPENAEELRNAVKRFGDIEMGIHTQCVRWSEKRVKEISNNKINQYHNNLILKINTRLGGINFKPARDWFKEPTMVFGADVSHPGPGSHQPSISALVGSVDPWYTRYVASTRVQDPRLEMIEDMESMFEELLERFRRFHKIYPRRIIFYRDGVSEGEFSQVDQVEIPRMAAVVERKYGDDKAKWPSLCFIIVGKKHHQRFFPRDEEGRDRNGNENMYPGYVVDVDIVHPVYPDFYLQSQAGLKGTSRPSHYTVIKATNIGIDELQEFTYNLCHCYLRATRSVKIPAPVYYADLVCGRAKFHFDEGNTSVSGDSNDGFDLEMWRRNYAPIHERLATAMYWI